MDGEGRQRRVLAAFGIGLVAVAGTLWIWWPAGVVVGVILATVATVSMGRRLQETAEAAPEDVELLDLLEMTPSGRTGGVVKTVLAEPGDPTPGRTSIR